MASATVDIFVVDDISKSITELYSLQYVSQIFEIWYQAPPIAGIEKGGVWYDIVKPSTSSLMAVIIEGAIEKSW